jgi:NitT/TauT family transport system substrate-binding protein
MSETKQEQFYKDGNADAVITFEPVKTKLKQSGAHVIFDSSMIPNEIFDLLIVHEDAYMKRKDDICEITRSWFDSLRYIDKNKQDAALRITKRLGVSISDFDGLMEGIILPGAKENHELLGGNPPGLIIPSKRLANIMVNEKQLSHFIDINEAIDTDLTSCYAE